MLPKNETNNHSVFSLHYHLVIVIKYRKTIITKQIENELKEIFERVSPTYGIRLEEIGSEPDHIHFLFAAKPNTNISKFINVYKAASSRLVKKAHPEIKQHLWKEYFWSQSYYLATTGGAPLEVIREYVKSQGTKTPRYDTVNKMNAVLEKTQQGSSIHEL